MALINTFLATGQEIRVLERRLCTMTSHDADWARVGAEHRQLVERQREEIVAAVEAGVAWATVEFVLRLHGQHADREVGSIEPTPAEYLGALMKQHGAAAVVHALEQALGRLEDDAVGWQASASTARNGTPWPG